MAMLLGAAKLLKAREGDLAGTVLLVFQPAEEGGAGAQGGGMCVFAGRGGACAFLRVGRRWRPPAAGIGAPAGRHFLAPSLLRQAATS